MARSGGKEFGKASGTVTYVFGHAAPQLELVTSVAVQVYSVVVFRLGKGCLQTRHETGGARERN